MSCSLCHAVRHTVMKCAAYNAEKSDIASTALLLVALLLARCLRRTHKAALVLCASHVQQPVIWQKPQSLRVLKATNPVPYDEMLQTRCAIAPGDILYEPCNSSKNSKSSNKGSFCPSKYHLPRIANKKSSTNMTHEPDTSIASSTLNTQLSNDPVGCLSLCLFSLLVRHMHTEP